MKKNIFSATLFMVGLLAYSCLAFTTGKSQSSQRQSDLVIGLFADPQYSDTDSRGLRIYRSALTKLPECISMFNEEEVDMAVCLGDIVDCNPLELDTILQIADNCKAPIYYVMGNHDFSRLKDVPAHIHKLGMPSLYYSVLKDGWKFIFLDTNDIAAYVEMSPGKKEEYNEMMNRIKSQGTKNGQVWNGGIGREQMRWLSRELELAKKEGLKVIVFGHHPIFPLNDHSVLNYADVLKILTSYSCVKAYINGHYHPGKYAVTEDGLPCISLEAMLEGGEQNSFAVIRLGQDSIYFNGYGRVKSHVMPYRY